MGSPSGVPVPCTDTAWTSIGDAFAEKIAVLHKEHHGLVVSLAITTFTKADKSSLNPLAEMVAEMTDLS